MRRIILLSTAGTVAVAAAVAYSVHVTRAAEQQFAEEVQQSQQVASRQQLERIEYAAAQIPRNAALASVLADMGLDRSTVNEVVEEAQRVFDLRKVRAGRELTLGRSVEGEFRSLRYLIDPEHELLVVSGESGPQASVRELEHVSETVTVSGTIEDSLFNAIVEAGEGPQLAIELASIFAWDMDFYTDPRKGDTFRIVVEKKVVQDSNAVTYGRIQAAEYNNDGSRYQAVLFQDGNSPEAYYTPDGKSLKKAFLRSPLKFAAPVTSRFTHRRFHPVLKRYRPHLGIDYGAPRGTPVQAVADGKVVFAGRKGGAGNMVHLRHANGFETQYLHLSRILVRKGQQVQQGRTVGLVGSTGLATGPHLDFRVRRNGKYQNFLALKLPPAKPVSKANFAKFAEARDRWMAMMQQGEPLLARNTGGAADGGQ